MLFNSLPFWIFFTVFLALYVRFDRVRQNWLLLLGSYVFYGAWDWRFVGLLILTTVVDWFVALRIAAAAEHGAKKRWLLVSIVTDLTVLGFFKYYNFFAGSLVGLAASAGITLEASVLHVVLPVGISFYTFQSLGYVIDVYRGRVDATPSLLEYGIYTAFFPQLVAGPIERAWHMIPQVRAPREVTREGLSDGLLLIAWGLFKKVYIADNLSEIVTSVFDGPGPLDGLSALVGVYAFAFQIYGDFSGYTDIARGLGRILGFNLFSNFHLPYFAVNPADFWRRWHISLSTWLRDYLYIPLGGNRKGTVRTHINLMITMLLGGLWHGAAWTFVLWGGYHGVLLVLHRLARPVLDTFFGTVTGLRAAIWRVVRVVGTFNLVCVGWILFRARSLEQVGHILSAMGTGIAWTPRGGYYLSRLVLLVSFLLIVQLIQAWRDDLLVLQQLRPGWARATLYLYLFCSIWFLGNLGGHEFIYFQF